MRALIVGAGAVGQVYGHHLARGGAEVAFLVKPKYAGEARAGFTLYPLNARGRKRTEPVRWRDYRVLTDHDEVAREPCDQVYLTVSSTAVRGDWLPDLARKIGDATVIALQPGLDDREHVLQFV